MRLLIVMEEKVVLVKDIMGHLPSPGRVICLQGSELNSGDVICYKNRFLLHIPPVCIYSLT